MPRAPKVCSKVGCVNVLPCPTHKPAAWQGSTRSRRLPSDWRARRARVLRRDPMCRACHVRPSTEVDHIVAGDDHRQANLQGLCHQCHRAKTSREATEARARRRGPPGVPPRSGDATTGEDLQP